MTTQDILSMNLRKLRTDKGLSQKELSVQLRAGISDRTISNWENRTRDVGVDDLVLISKYYGVTTDYLLGLAALPNDEVGTETLEEDISAIVAKDVFPYDHRAVGSMFHLFKVISNAIRAWESIQNSGYVSSCGAIQLFEFFAAFLNSISESKTSLKGLDENKLVLLRFANGCRDYIAKVTHESFTDERLADMIRGICDVTDIEHDVYNMTRY